MEEGLNVLSIRRPEVSLGPHTGGGLNGADTSLGILLKLFLAAAVVAAIRGDISDRFLVELLVGAVSFRV